jgi:peptidoglycan/xylan/chitin deacetylase (PgdA/CDA1 family)
VYAFRAFNQNDGELLKGRNVSFPLFTQTKIRVAVTVDDLPSHSQLPSTFNRIELTKKMLRALKIQSVPEVYGFINAEQIGVDKNLNKVLDLWVASGYPLGNHTYSHQSLNNISIQDFKKEIDNNESVLQTLVGKSDWKYFRYPFLREGNNIEKRNAIRSYLNAKDYKIAQVTIDFEDWSWNEPFARCFDNGDFKKIEWLKESYLQNAVDQLLRAEKISQALFHRSIAHILLLHIGVFDSEMIEDLIIRYKNEGVEFIPLSEAVKDEVYSIDPGYTFDRGTEFTYQVLRSRGLKLKDIGLEPYANYPEQKLNSLCIEK